MITGCASINSLPQSAADIDFDQAKEGRTGWSKYEEVFLLRDIDKRRAYLAAKAGLSDAGFTIKRADYDKGFALGEHGITPYDWNIVAGVYIKQAENGCYVKVLVQGSRDIGFWGDMTGSSWPQDIFKGMRNYIFTDSNTAEQKKKHFE
jgi:hypothetical protein